MVATITSITVKNRLENEYLCWHEALIVLRTGKGSVLFSTWGLSFSAVIVASVT